MRIKGGNGGAGCVSFRSVKYIEFAGPDGGDGGAGGSVFIQASEKVLSLSHIRRKRKYFAENGRPGMGNDRSGRKGRDEVIRVPLGTQLLEAENRELVHDFDDTEPYLVVKGARGGKGNAFFKSSTRQAPRFAQPGEQTEEKKYILSLKLIADVGLVGFPNAGKSTLLAKLTHAKPKVANYPFTTLSPNLGMLDLEGVEQVVIADIPGILEGASKGVGLGLSFLKHIERVKVLLFVLDVTTTDVYEELQILRAELRSYNEKLLERPFIIVFNKCDLIDDEDFLQEWLSSFEEKGYKPLAVSAVTGLNLEKLTQTIGSKLHEVTD